MPPDCLAALHLCSSDPRYLALPSEERESIFRTLVDELGDAEQVGRAGRS